MFGPEEDFGVVDRESGEDAASIKHRGRNGSDARFGRLYHCFVEVDDGMHPCNLWLHFVSLPRLLLEVWLKETHAMEFPARKLPRQSFRLR